MGSVEGIATRTIGRDTIETAVAEVFHVVWGKAIAIMISIAGEVWFVAAITAADIFQQNMPTVVLTVVEKRVFRFLLDFYFNSLQIIKSNVSIYQVKMTKINRIF